MDEGLGALQFFFYGFGTFPLGMVGIRGGVHIFWYDPNQYVL